MTRAKTFSLLFPALLVGVPVCAQNPPDRQTEPAHPRRQAGLMGKMEFYSSKMDGKKRPYAVCATSDSSAAKPLVVVVDPGARTEAGSEEVVVAEEYAWYAKKNGRECVVIRPTGRGPGSLYQNYGEVDALDAIEDVAAKCPVDRDRVSVIGASMGGAATWFLVSHYPDVFAAGAPMAGYCDYRLWEKPGGYTFPLRDWEESSWQARSAPFLIENFQYTPLWIVHGAWDRSVGGGVPVAHSREMVKLLTGKGFEPKYTEMPKIGHFIPPEVAERVVLWLIEQKKIHNPKHVSLATFWLRHNRSYWMTIDQFERYGRRAFIDADQAGSDIVVKTANVRAFTMGPLAGSRSNSARIDGQPFQSLEPGGKWVFRRSGDGTWKSGAEDLSSEKHHGSSGPISDIFFDKLILVPGTIGTDEESFFNSLAAGNTQVLFKQINGGLHRGGILGSNTVDLDSIKDVEMNDEQIRNNNLLLFGTTKTNSILRRYRDRLALSFGSRAIHLGDRTYLGEKVTVLAVFPHPDNPSRYISVHGGVTADALTWGSHLSVQLLPDYVIYDGGKMLDWGFWDNAWKHPARPMK